MNLLYLRKKSITISNTEFGLNKLTFLFGDVYCYEMVLKDDTMINTVLNHK